MSALEGRALCPGKLSSGCVLKQCLSAFMGVERPSCFHRHALQVLQHPSTLLGWLGAVCLCRSCVCFQLVDAALLQIIDSLAAAHSACCKFSSMLACQACGLQCTAAASCLRLLNDQRQVYVPQQCAAARGHCMHCATAASCTRLQHTTRLPCDRIQA